MTPKQVLAQFSPVIISPLNKYIFDKRYNTENMTLIATPEKFETPLFLKNGVFAPLNASRVGFFKNTPFYAFFWSRMCTLSYLTGPPGFLPGSTPLQLVPQCVLVPYLNILGLGLKSPFTLSLDKSVCQCWLTFLSLHLYYGQKRRSMYQGKYQ